MKAIPSTYRTVSAHANGEYTTHRADGAICCEGEYLCEVCEAAVRSQTVPPPPSLLVAVHEKRSITAPVASQVQLAANGVPQPPSLLSAIQKAQGVA